MWVMKETFFVFVIPPVVSHSYPNILLVLLPAVPLLQFSAKGHWVECHLWQVGIKHLCGFLLLFWRCFMVSSLLGILGCLLFPACWEYCSCWRRILMNRRWWVQGRWGFLSHWWAEVKAWFVALTFLSQGAEEVSGSLCSSSVCQAFVLPKGAAAGADWELLQFCFLGTAVQLAAGLQLELHIISRWLCCVFMNLAD